MWKKVLAIVLIVTGFLLLALYPVSHSYFRAYVPTKYGDVECFYMFMMLYIFPSFGLMFTGLYIFIEDTGTKI